MDVLDDDITKLDAILDMKIHRFLMFLKYKREKQKYINYINKKNR